jgi:phage FluMu protein Com
MYPCRFCNDSLLHVQFEGHRLCTARCQKCSVIHYLHYVEHEAVTIFKYSIFTKYKEKVFSISIQTDYDDAQIFMHPDDPRDTLVMVAHLSGAMIKNRINPSNFLDKLPYLLTFS